LTYFVKPDYFVSYLSVNVMPMAVFAFILLREMRIGDRLNAFLAPLGRASFGIYLVRVIVLALLEKIPGVRDWFSAGSAVYMIPLLGLLGFILSYFVVAMIQRIPVLRWAVP
jgi:surface polysaccharide O-acyltransferase-like enzyme